MNITTARRITNRSVPTCIAAMIVTGVVIAAPPATASIPAPDPGTTTSATSFDIGEYVARRKAQMAQDRVDRAQELRAAPGTFEKDTVSIVADRKSRAAQDRVDRAGHHE